MDRRLKHTDAASTYHHHHVQSTADDAYDAVGERAPRPRARVTLPAALASMLLIASLAAGACCTTGAWAVEAGPGQTTGDGNASSQPSGGGQGTGPNGNGAAGGDAGSQTGGTGSGSTGSDGNAGTGSTGGGEPTAPAPTPAPAPSQPTWTWTVHRIYLNWGPVLGSAVDSVDVPAGSVAQAVEGRAVDGYKFDGWAYDADCTVPFDWSAPVYSDQSAWACYEKTPPAYSASDLSGVTVDVDGVKRAISPGTTTTVSHDARISLDGVPSGWTVTKTTGADGVEEITVTSPDGKTSATWSFRRKPAVGSAGSRSGSGSGMEPRSKAKAAGKHGGAHAGVEEPALLTTRRQAGGGLPINPKAIALAVVAVVGAAVVAACLARLRRLDAMETETETGDNADGAAPMESGELPASAVNASAGDGACDSAGSQTPSSEAPTQLMRPAAMPLTMDSGEAPELADLVRRTTGGLEPEAASHGDGGPGVRTEPSMVVSPQETLDTRR